MIHAEALSYAYPGGARALDGVNLAVGRGEFVALMGVNGSGKTTLLKLLIGLLKPSGGRITLDGTTLASMKDRDIFKKVGMVFQDPNDQLFAATVDRDVAFGLLNLGIPAAEASAKARAALRMVGAPDIGGRAIHTLSYGQKRRAALAGVIAMEPEVILLDEPTGGLDPRGVNPIMLLLRRLNRERGITMIMATHDVELVPLFCDRIIVLRGGRVVAADTPQAVLGDPVLTRSVELRVPRVTHLAEILSREDGVRFAHLPLTIGEARREMIRLSGRDPEYAGESRRPWVRDDDRA